MGTWPNPLQQVAEAGFVIAKAAGPRALMPPCGNECWWPQQDLLVTSQLFQATGDDSVVIGVLTLGLNSR